LDGFVDYTGLLDAVGAEEARCAAVVGDQA
jgi:hypothetical protein